MPSQTNEQALETLIEKQLTGTTLEEQKAHGLPGGILEERSEIYRSGNGYYIGAAADFNPKIAIDEIRFWD